MKNLFLGLVMLVGTASFATTNVKGSKVAKITKTEVSSKTTIDTKVDSGCFSFTMTGDNGSLSGSWCGSMGGFLAMVDAFLAN